MTILELRFPAGRYHATPWGRHVNEGAVEWPPSPWRLLRSLIATWYLKAREDVTEEVLSRLMASLSSQLPQFHLPAATNGHTRHYMPVVEGKNEKTTKIFDTFIQLAATDAVLISWDQELPEDQLDAFRILAGRLGYFGRAESLVEAFVRDDIAAIKVNSRPIEKGEGTTEKTELVRLLVPLSPTDYETWRTEFITANIPPEKVAIKKGSSGKKNKGPEIPADLFKALHADTGDLQASGWNLPPGAVYLNYIRPSNAFAPAALPSKRTVKTPTVARYAVASTVAPRITQAVSVADRVHKSLCSFLPDHSPSAQVFSGKHADGKPLPGHQHAHIFCEANGPRDAITHITVTATMGFDEPARLALRQLNKVWGHGEHDIRLVLIGLGSAETFPDCKLFGPSKVWRSLTPFVSTRYGKTHKNGTPKIDRFSNVQIGSAAHDLQRLLAIEPQAHGVEVTQRKEVILPSGRALRCLQYQTRRSDGKGSRGNGDAGSFIIEFKEEISGPLALGYGSHFGLGLFMPVAES